MSPAARSLQVFGAYLLLAPALLLFGAVDAAAALWTWSALRRG